MAHKIVNKRMLSELLLKTFGFRYIGLRTFLSKAYSCEEAWQKRLDSPLLKSLNMNMYFLEVDKKFQTKRLASGVDIDMFANNVTKDTQLDELEHLLYRFRGTKRSVEVMESTHYATVRAFYKFNQFDSLFRIFRDRVDYGIFPDAYTYNLLMDTFCEHKRYRDAAEIAVLMMLQEDLTNPLSRILGLHSCHMFLTNCPLESYYPETSDEAEELKKQSEQNEEEDEDEEEAKYVRVPYIRNSWFDDHFDIKDPKALMGKTLYLIGREEKNPMGWSCQLIGLGMWKKWEKAAKMLDTLLQSSGAALLENEIPKFKTMVSEIEDNEVKTKWTQEFDNKLEDVQKKCKLCSGDIASAIEEAIKLIPTLEKHDIENQKQLFSQWEEARSKALKLQQQDIEKENKMREIAKLKEDLYWKERYLFFYEKEDDIMTEVEQVDELLENMAKKSADSDVYEPPQSVMKKPQKLSKLKKLAMIKRL